MNHSSVTALPLHDLSSNNEPTVEVVTVTPALAKSWLQRNTHNRNLRPRAVSDYARDMAAGKWQQNGEAVKFASNGALLDGQHRLTAVTVAGVPVPMLIVSGLDPATQETMDAGRKRSTSDALGLRGETNFTILASVLKRVWLWEQGDCKFNGNATPTTAECTALLNERPELRRSAEIAARVHQTFKYLPQSVVGTAHHVFSRIAAEEATWFFQRLADGAELPVGHPILTLRTRAMAEAADRRKSPADRHMAYLVRSWNAVRDGRELGRIQYGPNDAMPMPK
ncbi:hypothetical protein [Streptomyces sp. NEAU-174]|uniref:hypothetical protein n=1 Tax=Streptomyces sp. NEAU-174 TaxID=3458254 RepID=UPI0040448F89